MEQEICSIVEQALDLEIGSVTVDDNENTLDGWDSLGLLSILTSLEKRFGNQVASIDDIASINSIRGIIDILKRESII